MSINIRDRAYNMGNVVVDVVDIAVTPVKIVAGLALSVLSVVTLESDREIKSGANEWLRCEYQIPSLFMHLLRVIKPNSLFVGTRAFCFLTTYAGDLFEAAQKKYQSEENCPTPTDKFLQKHVVSRSLFALGAVVSVVTRTASLALGLISAAFAIVLLGSSEEFNSIAYDNLKFLAIISEVTFGIRGAINPRASL